MRIRSSWLLLLAFLVACGNEGRDTTWTGVSGVILGVLVFFVLVAMLGAYRRRKR